MSSFLFKTSFFLIVYLFLSHLVSPLLIKNNGYEIYDLQSNISDDFATEAADWTAFPLFSSSTPLYTECGSTYLLGGYEVLSNNGLYYRMFTDLPEHNSVHISITFFFIDRWEPQDSVSMEVSNTTSTSFNSVIYTLDSGQTAWSSSICGSSSADLPSVTLVMGFLHTGSNLALTITNSVSNSNPNRGYNGFRDVRIISSLDHTLATSECSIAPTGSLGSAYTCPCPAGESLVSSTCTGCDDSCENCFGAGASSCITCKSNYVYDGTLCQPCDDTCLTCSGTAATQCLTCNTGDYMYADGTCRSSCTGAYSPTTTTDGVQTCTLNCPSPKYIYSINDTCLDSCSSPFTNSPSGTNNYCNFPCSTSSYYSEGSCLSSCDSPYTIRNEGGYLYCDYPCQSSQYMMPDNTCGDSCDAPMSAATVNGKHTCQSPCSPSDSMYYYPDTSTCSSTCSGTSAQKQYYKTCTVTTTTNKTQETITFEQVNTVTTGVGGTGLVVATIVSSSSPSGALVGVLAKTFAYVRYLQIVYSTQLNQLLETFDTSFIPYQISSTPPSFLTSEKSYKPVPALFATWDIHPSFLMNFWSDMTSFGIAILALIVLKFLQIVLKRVVKKGDLSSYAKKGKVSAENFLLTFIYNSYGDIIFYALIEFKTTTFGSTESYAIIPFIAFFLLAGIALFIFHIYLLKRYQTLSKKGGTKHRKSPELKAFLEKYEGAEMFFKDFKTDSFMQQACLLFTTWRDALFNIIFIVLFDYPLAEVITIMVLNILMLIYLALIRPLKKPIEQVHQIASELLVLVLNSCIMTMAVLDYKGQTATHTRDILGKVVIVINIIFNALIALVMAIKIIKILIRVYKARKGGISKMIEGLNTAKSGRESVYAIPSEMNTLDKFSSRIAKLDEKAHDLTFEESAPKENPILASTAFDKYLGTGERLSIFFQTEKRDENEEQNKNDGELGSPVRNPRLEPSSPIIVNPAIENQALQDNQLPIWDFQRVSKAWKSVFGTPSESDL